MKLFRFLALFLVLTSCPLPTGAQEIRGFWADGFAEGFKTPEQVDLLLARLRKSNCNAVFAQMRKSADSYYQSRYDVWASDNPDRFDALQYLIEKAHSGTPRIQVHAWLNTFAVGKDRGNPLHITRTHPDWISISESGETHDGEATKLDPGHPDAADYTARVYLDVLRRYDVDGVHFDFVRYGGPRWGYNPVSVERFNRRHGRNGQPNPDDPAWKQWRRDQVTAVVRKVYALAASVKPSAQISAATVTWQEGPRNPGEWTEKSAAMNRVFQDWRAWMKEGILDLNCPMTYFNERRRGRWFRQWIDWAKENQFGRYAAPANGSWLNLIPDSLNQIAAIRNPSRAGNRARGVMLYSYAGTNRGPAGTEDRFNEEFYSALSLPGRFSMNPPFAEPTAYPQVTWKKSPTTGSLAGYAFEGPGLTPMDGAVALIQGPGVMRRVRSDGTGFFAMVGLKPGRYSLSLPQARTGAVAVTVSAGSTANTTLIRPSAGPTVSPSRSIDLRGIAAFSPVVLTDAIVLAGTDTIPGRLILTDTRGEKVLRAQLSETPILPFQPGDVVAVRGQWEPTTGEPVLDGAFARWTGAVSISPMSRLIRTIQAEVVDRSGHITLADRSRARILLGRRKAPGIEDEPRELTLSPGSLVRARGIWSPADTRADIVGVLYPVNLSDVQVIRGAGQNMVLRLAIWIGIALAAGALTYLLLRLRSRRA